MSEFVFLYESDPIIVYFLKSQVVLLQTAHSWANAGVLLGARMHRERDSFRNSFNVFEQFFCGTVSSFFNQIGH